MKKKKKFLPIRLLGRLARNDRPWRFLRLLLYLARAEAKILKRLTLYSGVAVVIHNAVLLYLTLVENIPEKRAFLYAYIANYTARMLLFKYKVFKEKDVDFQKLIIQWIPFMVMARFNAFMVHVFSDRLEWNLVATIAIMIPVSMIVVYIVSRFFVFKKH